MPESSDNFYAIRPPQHTLAVTPDHSGVELLFDQFPSGEESISVLFTDPEAGPVMVAFAADAIPHLINGLRGIHNNRDGLRADLTARRNLNGENN